MRLTLASVFCFLMVLGISAIPAHAQTLTDPSYILHGSPCVETFCIDLEYTGPTTCFTYVLPCPNPNAPPPFIPSSGDGPFLFGLVTPITDVPFVDTFNGTFNCSAVDLPGVAADDFAFVSFNNYTFLGCNYFGLLEDGQTFTWNSSVPGPLVPNPDIVVVPEPSSSILFLSGLLLLGLGAFTRKRLASNFSS